LAAAIDTPFRAEARQDATSLARPSLQTGQVCEFDLNLHSGAPLDRRASNENLQGGDMAHEPIWGRQAAPRTRAKSAGACIACMLFVAAMGAAFWIGTLWASQAWITGG
jgi:hypothetical protein